MSTEAKIAACRAYLLEQTARQFDHFTRTWTESPIETLFLAQMLAEGWIFPDQQAWSECVAAMKAQGLERGPAGYEVLVDSLRGSGEEGFCTLQPTVRIDGKTYRLDFAFVSKAGKLVVELDGHDFHERTKEQATRDKSRDRDLTAAGWRVLRFTGSEIYRDPSAALGQVVAIRQKLLDDHYEAFASARGGK